MATLTFLPRRIRSLIYAIVTLLGVVVAGCQAGFKAIGHADPVWLAFGAGALVPLSIAAGAVALSNVTPKQAMVPVDDLPDRNGGGGESDDPDQVDGDAGAGIVDSQDQLQDHSGDVDDTDGSAPQHAAGEGQL